MHERHTDKARYFQEQSLTTEKYVIPFISPFLPVVRDLEILEVGCGHGGNLKPFLDRGCRVTGLDINPDDTSTAAGFLTDYVNSGRLRLVTSDIYQVRPADIGVFDLLVLKDVIEHIPDQERFLGFVKQLLKPTGRIFFGFPPWQMPFGGHQQVCSNRVLSVAPYVHLLPRSIYSWLLRTGGETPYRVTELLEVKETGLSIERFRRILRTRNYRVEREQFFLIAPNYDVKFNLKPRQQLWLVSRLPFVRNFATTCVYALVQLPPA